MVFFVTAILLCLFILVYVIKLNVGQGKSLREWDWQDWIRVLVALYWLLVSGKLAFSLTLGPSGHTLIYPGVVLTLALVASTSIRKDKRVNGKDKH